MPIRLFCVTLLVVFAASSLVLGCASTKLRNVVICNSDPAHEGFQCTPETAEGVGESFLLPYRDTGNFVAMSPDDFEMFINFCRIERHGK